MAVCVCLPSSQQKVIDMKEVNTAMKESTWQDDKDITHCQLCKKAFSVARRKVTSLPHTSTPPHPHSPPPPPPPPPLHSITVATVVGSTASRALRMPCS